MARLSAMQKTAKRPAAVKARTSQASATPSSSASILTPGAGASYGGSSSPRTFSGQGKGKGKLVKIRRTAKTAAKGKITKGHKTGGGATGQSMTQTTTSKKKKRKGAVTRSTLREIAKLQKHPKLRIPKAVIGRMARNCADAQMTDVRFSKASLGVLHEAVESFVHGYLNDSNAITQHSKRVTLMPRDLGLATTLRGRN